MPDQERVQIRRQEDRDCLEHDERLSKVEKILSVQYGWIKSAAMFMAILLPVIGYYCVSIDTKLSTIISKQSAGDVAIAEIRGTVGDHDTRIKRIEDRHTWLDQNGVIKASPGRR